MNLVCLPCEVLRKHTKISRETEIILNFKGEQTRSVLGTESQVTE